MNGWDIRNEKVIDSAPELVWQALMAEFQGAARWWTPANTFRCLAPAPDRVGAMVEVTVHPKGADKGGPKLRFTARTRTVVPGRLLVTDYVGGVFSGTSTYTLTPVAGGRSTLLAMRFHAEPRGWVRQLAKVADVGQEHLNATRAAFDRLAEILRGSRPAAPASASSKELTAGTDDGARLAVTLHRPAADAAATTATVLLAHGWGADRRVWDAVVPHLTGQGMPVATYDQRGHGRSTIGTAGFGIHRLGRDLQAVVEATAAQDVIVVGHSGGGFAAMAYAVADAQLADSRLRGLVLLGTAAHAQYVGDGEVRMMGNPVFSWALRRGVLGRKMLRHTMGADVVPGRLELNRLMFAGTARQARANAFAASKDMDLRAGLAAVTVPTVVLAGAEDKVVKPELGEAIAAATPRARFERLSRVGHMIPLEVPALVARTVAELSRTAYQVR